MFQILHQNDLTRGAIAAVEFEGERYGAGVSFFVGHLTSGQGPGPHTHPYAETCIVLAGQVMLSMDGKEIVGRAGDIVVIEAGTKHGFKATGDGQLDMVCIHASDRIVIDWLDAEQPLNDSR